MHKLLTISKNSDVLIIYNYIKSLALAHGDNGIHFDLFPNQFVDAYNKNIFKVHLCKEKDNKFNGIMLHMKEYSLKFGGFGSYLDDFYLDPSSRGRGLGKKMLTELCQYLLDDKQKFIKVVFSDDLNLESFYNHLNFTNSGELNMYEGDNSDLRNILAVEDNDENEIRFTEISLCEGFPIYKIIVNRNLEKYSFCCQVYFNSWCGCGILFSDFSGETDIVNLSDFKSGIKKLLDEIGWDQQEIRSIWWQIFENQKELGNCILSCEAQNITLERWKIAYLNEEGLIKLAQLAAR